MDKALETGTEADTNQQDRVEEAAPHFGSDDLGRLQTILLGDHARTTLERIETLEQALLGAIDDLRGEMRDRIKKVETSVASEANVRTTALANLTNRVDEETQSRTKAISQIDQRDALKAANKTIAGLDRKMGKLAGQVQSDAATQTQAVADLRAQAEGDVSELRAQVQADAASQTQAVAELRAQVESDAASGADALSQLRAQVESDAVTGADALSQLRARVEDETQVRAAALAEVNNELQVTETEFTQRLKSAEKDIDREISEVRNNLAETATNNDTKISRTELSSLLARLAAEVDSD